MIKTVVVATDGSAHANRAVALAGEVAAKFRARLVATHTLLHGASSETLDKLANRKALTKAQRNLLDTYEGDMAVTMAQAGVAPIATIPPPAELLQVIGSQILERAAAAAKKAGVKQVATRLASGEPADDVLDAAKREKADLIVLGTRGLGEIKGLLLGSVSHKVSARAGCAVLTVK
jgi:nucleotide-binding universal stress UspA family protein